MAASLLRSFSSPFPGPENSPTPPAKRFAPAGSSPEIVTRCDTKAAALPRRSSSSLSIAVGKGAAERVDEQFRHYDPALRVYSAVRNGRQPGSVHFPDAATKRKVYRLVFDVLYHREVIEELLIESGFYSRNCDLHGQVSLVLLMTFDYQDSKFLLKMPRDRSENIPSLVLRVGEALFRHRVRLNAALARMRVKSNARTTSQLLSEAAYLKYQAVITEPYYVRVNSNQVRNVQAEIVSSLCNDGFIHCSSKEEVQKGKKSFCQLHRNLLAFSPDTKEAVLQHWLLTGGYLVQQDSTSFLFVEGMRDVLSECSGAVIITHCNAGVEVAHVASMLSEGVKVIVYGVLPVQVDSLTRALHTQDVNNVEFVHAPFSHAVPTCEDLADVSTIICLPPSSLSTVTQPLDFIHQEGDHFVPLLLSEKNSLMKSLPREQESTLAQALTFCQCQNIVYAVRSREQSETTNIVATALGQHRAAILAKKEEGGRRDYLPKPVHSEADLLVAGLALGYHVTLLERKPEDPKPTPSEVIAKAVTSGTLSGEGLDIGTQHQIPTKKKKKKGPRIFSQHKGIPMTISAQNKVMSKKLPAHDSNTRRPFR